MAKAENDDDLFGPLLRSALRGHGHVRRVAFQTGRELDTEQNESVISIARVLGEIDDVESRTDLQTRMMQLEEQVERLSDRRDEMDQALESKIHLLRTTLESALEAIAVAEPIVAEDPIELVESVREEFSAKLQELRSVLSVGILQLQKRIESADPAAQVQELREEFEERLYESEHRIASATDYLEAMILAERERIDHQKAQQAAFRDRISKDLANFVKDLAAV
jgi:hypothetical protein